MYRRTNRRTGLPSGATAPINMLLHPYEVIVTHPLVYKVKSVETRIKEGMAVVYKVRLSGINLAILPVDFVPFQVLHLS